MAKRQRDEDVVDKEKKSKPSNKDWAFEVDYNDHFETPLVAYEDLKNALLEIARNLGKSAEELVIYDPYYCQGNMVSRLQSLGFKNIVNRNRDFYKDVKNKTLPGNSMTIVKTEIINCVEHDCVLCLCLCVLCCCVASRVRRVGDESALFRRTQASPDVLPAGHLS